MLSEDCHFSDWVGCLSSCRVLRCVSSSLQHQFDCPVPVKRHQYRAGQTHPRKCCPQQGNAICSVISPVMGGGGSPCRRNVASDPDRTPIHRQRIRRYSLLSCLVGYLVLVVGCDGTSLGSETLRRRTWSLSLAICHAGKARRLMVMIHFQATMRFPDLACCVAAAAASDC